jgi:hypothetical protein
MRRCIGREHSFEKSDVAKGRKIVGHMVRMVTLALQLAASGRITDIEEGNAVYRAANDDVTMWTAEDAHTAMDATVTELLARLSAA